MKKKLALSLVLMNLFLAFVGIGLVIPVMPTIMNELGITGSTVGLMVAAFAIAQLIFSPIAGKWTDTIGRKKMIVVGLIIFAISEFFFAIGTNVEMLFISRILGGISGAFIMPAVTAFIADITTVTERPRALGLMSAAISTGFIIGPGVGGFLAAFGTRVPFFVATMMALIAAVLSFITLREPERRQNAAPIAQKHDDKSIKRVFSKVYFIPFAVLFISTFGLAAFDSFFSLFTNHKFNFTPTDIAISITVGAIFGAIAQGILFAPLTRKLGEIRLVRWCLGISAVVVLLMTLAPTHFTVMLVTFFAFIGFDLIRPAITTYLSKIAGHEQGFVGGMNSMFTSLGNIIGPLLGGMLFDLNVNLPFQFAAVVLILALLITFKWIMPKFVQQTVGEVIEER